MATGQQENHEGGTPEGATGKNAEEKRPSTLLSQQLEGDGGVDTGVDGGSNRSGNDQRIDLGGEVSTRGKTRKQAGTMRDGGSGSGLGESNAVEGGGGVGRGVKGRWVATMMVPGRKLWDSSPAMMSQYKRFRRSRQGPKIARDQVCDA